MLAKFFSDPANTPFLIALVVMAALSILAVIATLTGMIGLDLDADIDTPTESFLDFLGLTAVPSSMFVVISSCTFFLTGFATQWIAYAQSGKFLSGWIAVIPALIVTLAALHATGRIFKKFQVKEYTSAVHSDTFIGMTATIVGGTARLGFPAQGKLTDSFRQTHYILIEPAHEAEMFPEGSEVVLLKRSGPKYFATAASLDSLSSIDVESLTESLDQRK